MTLDFQFSNPAWLWLLLPALAVTLWFSLRSDVSLHPARKWTALILRLLIVFALVFAIAGLQWKKSVEGMNVLFLLDRSDSIPSGQQEVAREAVVKAAGTRKSKDKIGLLFLILILL